MEALRERVEEQKERCFGVATFLVRLAVVVTGLALAALALAGHFPVHKALTCAVVVMSLGVVETLLGVRHLFGRAQDV